MKFVLEAASTHLGSSSGKPATPATKAKMVFRILKPPLMASLTRANCNLLQSKKNFTRPTKTNATFKN
jgi:hypothetical protein